MDLKVLWTISGSMGTAADLDMLKNSTGFNIEVITADSVNGDHVAFEMTGKRYILPSGRDKKYIAGISSICRAEGVTTIIPQYGDELVPLSENMVLFKKMGIKVLVSGDTNKLEIANNKRKLYDFFKGKEFIPAYECIADLKGMEKAVHAMGYPYSPVCIKPVSGEGGRGFKIVTNERVDIFNERAETIKTRWEILKQQLMQMDNIPEIIVMEYLPGLEYSVDCVCKDGETYVCIPRQRVKTAMGVAITSIIEENKQLIDISRYIISKLNLSYNVNLQFKYSIAGKPKLLEVNPRVSGSLIANYGAGVNMLELALKVAYGIPVGSINVKWGTKMLRYWNQMFINK